MKLIAPIRKIINEALVFSSVKAKQADVRIDLDLEKNISLFRDDIAIEQVIVNLINNAIDAVADQKDKWIKIVAKVETQHTLIQTIDNISAFFHDETSRKRDRAWAVHFEEYSAGTWGRTLFESRFQQYLL